MAQRGAGCVQWRDTTATHTQRLGQVGVGGFGGRRAAGCAVRPVGPHLVSMAHPGPIMFSHHPGAGLVGLDRAWDPAEKAGMSNICNPRTTNARDLQGLGGY
jgi:hypothetical protein